MSRLQYAVSPNQTSRLTALSLRSSMKSPQKAVYGMLPSDHCPAHVYAQLHKLWLCTRLISQTKSLPWRQK